MKAEHARIALHNLAERKLRSTLTVIGIIIAVATIFVLISLSLGLEHAVAEQFRILGTDKLFIYPRGGTGGPGTTGAVMLTLEDVEIIEKVAGVHDLSYSVAAPAEIRFRDEVRFFNVVGYPLDHAEVFIESGAYIAEEGKLLSEGDEGNIMIGNHYKHNNIFKRPVRVRDTFEIQGVKFEVQGILEPIGNPGDDRLIYMSLDEARELFNISQRVDFIIVQVEAGSDIDAIAERISRRLMNSRDVDEESRDFTIQTPEELLSSFGDVLNIITAFLLAVAAISLLVGGIGIANTMYTSVLERTKNIGVMKAIGAQNRDIFSIFVFEAGFLGAIGGVLGVLLGWAIGETIEYVAVVQLGTTLLQIQAPLLLFSGCMAFAFIIGIVFGALPSLRASKSNVVDALRYE